MCGNPATESLTKSVKNVQRKPSTYGLKKSSLMAIQLYYIILYYIILFRFCLLFCFLSLSDFFFIPSFHPFVLSFFLSSFVVVRTKCDINSLNTFPPVFNSFFFSFFSRLFFFSFIFTFSFFLFFFFLP